METLLIFSVLSAAFLHAFWNFQVKDTPNKAMGMAAVMFGHLPLAGVGLLYSGLPSLEAAPYLVASAFLHLGYQVFLLNAYRFGSLTSIYPIARGMAPLLITLVSILILNEMLEDHSCFCHTHVRPYLVLFFEIPRDSHDPLMRMSSCASRGDKNHQGSSSSGTRNCAWPNTFLRNRVLARNFCRPVMRILVRLLFLRLFRVV